MIFSSDRDTAEAGKRHMLSNKNYMDNNDISDTTENISEKVTVAM